MSTAGFFVCKISAYYLYKYIKKGRKEMAKLYFRYGAMGSSKTANALMVAYNYRERGKLPLLAKPKTDTREIEIGRASCRERV